MKRDDQKFCATRVIRVCLPAALMALSLAGCDTTEYIIHVALGQLGVQGNVEPIDEVLAGGRLTGEQEDKLRLILEIRQFGIDHMGLEAGDSYTTFYDTSGDPLAFNLSASQKDALVPRIWTFPIVGSIPYLGFFDLEYARRIEQDEIADGMDTYLYEVDAYSTLGVFADPVRSPMLERSVSSLADTILHELLHNTVWRNGDTEFNESLATFVGRTGGLQFLTAKFGANAPIVSGTEAFYEDLAAVNVFLLELFADLEAYYARPLLSEDKIAGRESVFQAGRDRYKNSVNPGLNDPELFSGLDRLPSNNAWLLGNYRYNLDLELFEAVFDSAGGSWPETLAAFSQAAAAPGDAKDFLRNWLNDRGVSAPSKPVNRRPAVPPPFVEQFPVLALPLSGDGLAPARSVKSDPETFPAADESCRVRQRERVWADSPN